MENYRDYGTIEGTGLTGTPINTVRYGQVYQATHDGVKRLPYMKRSFISFTYGNKHIEDFDLIATISNNRLSRDGYASFKDNISTYDNLDGQFYWNTHYANNIITFNLATDGIDQRKLDNFLNWFSAGVSRELVLSEHPNRAIMARVSNPPTISLLPFESTVEMNIAGEIYKTKTTLYKGEITLVLISDDPHWYAINNILGKKSGDRYIDQWTDANGNDVSIFASQDALKILYEDGIPLGSMIENNMLLGDGAFAKVEDNVESLIWSKETVTWEDGVPVGSGARIDGNTADEPDYSGVSIPGIYQGRIAGAIIDANGNGITELPAIPGEASYGYFFYAGTAPAPTIISFDIYPTFNDSGYFISINNDITNIHNPFSSFFIESIRTQELRITTPSIATSYNMALKILLENINKEAVEKKELIIEKVHHAAVRAYVNRLLEEDNSALKSDQELITIMKQFWGSSDNYHTMHFSFNSKTGEALVSYSIQNNIIVTEDAGDMLASSNNIMIRERNYANSFGKFVHWENTDEEGRQYSHRIYHNLPVPIQNVQILYRNMYL